jgi:hypothetical protein
VKIEVTQPKVEDLFKSFYAIPKFQREYVWKEEQVTALLEDVFEALFDESGAPMDSEYFIGSLVVYPDDEGVFQLIDGQQRTTSLFLILCALRDGWRDAENADMADFVEGLLQTKKLDTQGRLRANFRLKPLYEDAQEIFEIIGRGLSKQDQTQGGIDQLLQRKGLSNSSKNMLHAYAAAQDFFTRFNGDEAGRIRFFQALIQKVRLVRIETPGVADALRIFETINDRGVGLNAMDLLKNLLFMQASKDQYEQLTKIWKQTIDLIEAPGVREKPLRFLRYYLLSRYSDARDATKKPLTEDGLYKWLDENKSRPDVAIAAEPLAFAQDLHQAARTYAEFITQPPPALAHITRLSARARQHMVVMLAAPGLTPEEIQQLTQQLESLFVSYLLTRQATKALDLVFANAAPKLRLLIAQQPPSQMRLEALKTFVHSWVAPELDKLRVRLDAAFDGLTLERKTMTRFVLTRISMHLDELAGWPSRSINDYWTYHIEHILPNTPTQQQLQRFDVPQRYDEFKQMLGNLTLLPPSINTSLGSDGFEEKRTGYRRSGVFMTCALVESQGLGGNGRMDQAGAKLSHAVTWNSRAIELRQQELKTLARELWRFPAP